MEPKINSYRIEKEWAIFKIPRCVLVFSRAELFRAIKRGKSWKRFGGERLTETRERGYETN